MAIVFGPVPSRRLGRSLGINNIPPKECSYACVYCQLGNTIKLKVVREEFYTTEQIVEETKELINKVNSENNKINYLTIVPDGEPTLDPNLGKTIRALKRFNIKIAVITNSSLLDNKSVRNDLLEADWVSVKVDAISENVWREIDRPHGKLNLQSILSGVKLFAAEFPNYLAVETMLVKGINDSGDEVRKISKYVKSLNPNKVYISIPTRPPAETNVESPNKESLNMAYQIFATQGLNVELNTGYEGNEFSSTGNLGEDILNITAVHPMRKDAVEDLIKKNNGSWEAINYLVESGKLLKSEFNGSIFYMRNLKEWRKNKNN
ncbi:MAG: radical SAM protein [Bacteroidetes bacterium]|nr:radical SAM protein [Bacteroidota bacterium]MBU1115899.1 radical SAM protein [Bacteroidota bacterium]MBU1798742.1 radical SAM protein [Bacteroidota bacterium]